MLRHPRVSWLAACALLFACGGDPAPKQVESPRSTQSVKAKKKKKKHKSEDAEASSEGDKPKSKEEKERELDREAEIEKQERKERQRKREQEAEEETRVAASDDGGGSSEADSTENTDEDADARKAAEEDARAQKKAEQEEAKAKKKAAREEALAKKKAAAEEAKAKKLAAAEAKKKKKKKKKKGNDDAKEASGDDAATSEGEPTKTDEETASASEEKTEEETPKATKKGVKESKAKKKVAAADAEEKPSDEEAPKAKARKGKAKAKAKAKAKENENENENDDNDDDSEKSASKETEKTDEESIDMEDTRTASIKDPSHDSDELDLTSTPTAPKEEEEIAPPVPLEIDRRPLTAAKSKLEVHGGVRVAVSTAPNGMGGSVSSTSEGLALGATYGLGGKAEVGFDYTVGLNPGSAKGPLLFHGAYRVIQSDKLDMALAGGFGVDFISVTDPATMMTTSQTATALELGGWVRYHVGRTLSVFTGLPALPSSSGNLSSTAALPPLPYQLTIGLSSKGAIGLDLPVGAGFQATPKIYAFATLDLAHIGMSNTNSAFVFADFIPLALGGFYAANKIDIGAVLGDDLKQGADYLRFDIVARYSLK